MSHPNFQNSMLGELTLSELVAPFIDPGTHANGHSGSTNGPPTLRPSTARASRTPCAGARAGGSETAPGP